MGVACELLQQGEVAEHAAEVGVGLAMVLLIYRNRRSISLDELSEMKG